MNLYIIGNGFDLAHDLPTNYWDFRAFLSKAHPEFLNRFEEQYDIYSGMEDNEKKRILWNCLETNLANIHEDILVENGMGIDLDLESGNTGIEDTLFLYFSEQLSFINKLSSYLKNWVQTIRIRDCLPRTSHISPYSNDYFINFNYTAVLETIYQIPDSHVIHIHGSLRTYTPDPVIGHGNLKRIEEMRNKIARSQNVFDEKQSAICRAIERYYEKTFKDVSRYWGVLDFISDHSFDSISIIGHSVCGVDLPYFSIVDEKTGHKKPWVLYCHHKNEAPEKVKNLISAGIDNERIYVSPSTEFFDIEDEETAKRIASRIQYSF